MANSDLPCMITKHVHARRSGPSWATSFFFISMHTPPLNATIYCIRRACAELLPEIYIVETVGR